MIETVKIGVDSVLDALRQAGLTDAATVVLVGSGARGARNWRSDIDVLVLHEDGHRIRLKRPGDIHLQQDSRTRFLERLEEGDDYPGWALRFGKPIRDPDGWWAKQATAEFENPHWPDWRQKVEHAKKRMGMASELLALGDVDAASEELLFAASHVARAVLLKRGVFPLSRPEMASQLEPIDLSLARLLRQLINDDLDAAGLTEGESLVYRWVERLSGALVPQLGAESWSAAVG